MKLTKGKIVKLYSKNKQTKKRNKKERHTTKTKTFRRTKPFDLSNRTLKRIPYGGALTDQQVSNVEQNDVKLEDALPNQEESQIVEPTNDNVEPTNDNVEPEKQEPTPNTIENQKLVQMNDVDDESDNLALAQAFKTLAKYVASQIKNNMVVPIVHAAQTQGETEN
jgi:hypothetical protein